MIAARGEEDCGGKASGTVNVINFRNFYLLFAGFLYASNVFSTNSKAGPRRDPPRWWH